MVPRYDPSVCQGNVALEQTTFADWRGATPSKSTATSRRLSARARAGDGGRRAVSYAVGLDFLAVVQTSLTSDL